MSYFESLVEVEDKGRLGFVVIVYAEEILACHGCIAIDFFGEFRSFVDDERGAVSVVE